MGDWCLQFLLLTFAVTPLRRLSGWNWPIEFRRMLGLFAFFYGVKRDITWPVIYGAILELLLFVRIGFSIARRVRRHEEVL